MLKELCANLALLVLLFTACHTNDPAADIPAYLDVSNFKITNDSSELDIISQNITDVWVYVDNDYQGAYELPALIPIAKEGRHQIELRPGIKNGGISADRRPYPYYELYSLPSYKLIPGYKHKINAITFYDEDPTPIKIDWTEDFEGLGTSFTLNPQSDTGIYPISRSEYPDDVFHGDKSGRVIMDEGDFLFEIISPDFNNFPRTDIPIYLEMNYKSNHEFIVGLYVNNKSEQIPIYIVKEQEDWNKIYLDFSTYVQASPPNANFNVFIGFTRKSSVPKAEVYLDNIKLIHF